MLAIVLISFVVLVGVVLAIYSMPPDNKPPKKKEKRPLPVPQENPQNKEWETIAKRWEKHNLALQADIEKMKMDHKRALAEADKQEILHKNLVEKLALEKSWREKEQANVDKIKAHERELKEQIIRTEADLEKEHTGRLRAEREGQELKIKYDAVLEEKRNLSTKAMSLETTVGELSKEAKDLKKTNESLSRKREDIQWVAKSEYETLKKILLAKEEEFARLKKTLGG